MTHLRINARFLISISLLLLFNISLSSCLKNKSKSPTVADELLQEVMEKQHLKTVDLRLGTGATAIAGKSLSVHYVGKLTNGKIFDSSKQRNKVFKFTLGKGHVIEGWDLGLKGMKVGGIRRIVIPYELGYGKNGVSDVIPGESVLDFTVELLEVK